MPIMKYTPQFVERQYVPTNNLGIIDQVLAQRQKEYDTATTLKDAAVSELYGLQTTQGFEPERNRIVQELQNQIEAAAQKRGGDYGAAAKDIASIVASVQKNPFFQRNRQVMEQARYLEQMKARNPALRIIKDPRKLGYDQNMTEEDLQYQVLDPADILKATDAIFADRKGRIGELQAISHPVFGTIARQQKGMSDAEIQALSNEQTVDQVLAQAGYSNLKQTNPDIYNEMAGAIFNQLKGYNQGYVDTPWQPRGGGSDSDRSGGIMDLLRRSGYDLQPADLDEAAMINNDLINQLAVERAKEAGIPNITSYEDLVNAGSTRTVGTTSGSLSAGNPIYESKYASPYGKKAREITEGLNEIVSKDPRFATPRFRLSTLAATSPAGLTQAKGIISDFKENVVSNVGRGDFKPATKKDEKLMKDIKDFSKVEIVDVIPTLNSSKSSMILNMVGEDKDGKIINFKQYLPRPVDYKVGTYDPAAELYYGRLNSLSPELDINYTLATDPQYFVREGILTEAQLKQVLEERKINR